MSELLHKQDIYKLLLLVRRMTWRLRCAPEDKEEIGQEVMLKLLTSKSVPPTFTRAWLKEVFRNIAIDFLRRVEKESKRMDRSIDISGASVVQEGETTYEPAAPPVDLDHLIDSRGLIEKLAQDVITLSVAQKKVLCLHADGLTYDEIALRTGAKVGTVRSRLYCARLKARKILADA